MTSYLPKIKEAFQKARENQDNPEQPKLHDIVLNQNTGEFRFIWEQQDEK